PREQTTSTASLQNHQHYIISLILSSLYIIFVFPVGFIGSILILVVNLSYSGCLKAPDLYSVFNLKQGYYDKTGLCIFMSLFQQLNMYSSIFFSAWMSFSQFVALSGFKGCSMPCARLIRNSSSLFTLLPFAITQTQHHAGELHLCFMMLRFLLPFCILGLCYWRIAQVRQRIQRERGGSFTASSGRPSRMK
uniref:Uncharacterized protein n=1 Tax=Monopterus albus TaxID=43700 RepID=A0A3Q3IEP4_MONAL